MPAENLDTTNAKPCGACTLVCAGPGTGTRKRQTKLWKKCRKTRSICEKNVILNFPTTKVWLKQGKRARKLLIITIMSNQLLHAKFMQCECRLPPLLPLPLNRTPTYIYPPTPFWPSSLGILISGGIVCFLLNHTELSARQYMLAGL